MSLTRLIKGLWQENPVFCLVLGLCPALAVSNSVENGLGMGFATIFVLICSSVIISLLAKKIPNQIRIPSYIVIIATFVTIASLFMAAFFPALNKALGIYVPLIVVNCIILGRAEAFASKHNLKESFMDALGMGLGFTIALVIISFIREILGTGKIVLFGLQIINIPIDPAIIFILPSGALLVMGLLLALFNILKKNKKPLKVGCHTGDDK